MTSSRVLSGIIAAVFCLTFASVARADRAHGDDLLLEKLIFADRHGLSVECDERVETSYLYVGHFENNNGKHLGFSMASVHHGPKLGIVRPGKTGSDEAATPNPEPTAMVLLGTGLAAAGAFARKVNRRRKSSE